MGDEDLSGVIVEGFLEDVPRQIRLLEQYLENRTARDCERQAHTIKGASANVGGECLREVAFEMEKSARAGDLAAVGAGLIRLKEQFELLREAMRDAPDGRDATHGRER